MHRFCIITKDMLFARQLQLMLAQYGASSFLFDGNGALPAASFYLADVDSVSIPDTGGVPLLCLAWNQSKPEGDFLWLDRPFRPARLAAAVGLGQAEEKSAAFPFPFAPHKSVLTEGGEVRLSETEFRLYLCLYEAKGEPLTRETLHKAVWNGEGDDGIVNVYIHYLRSKLETAGTRLISAVRGKGYALVGKEKKHATPDLR